MSTKDLEKAKVHAHLDAQGKREARMDLAESTSAHINGGPEVKHLVANHGDYYKEEIQPKRMAQMKASPKMEKTDACKKCNGMHKSESCVVGKSFAEMKKAEHNEAQARILTGFEAPKVADPTSISATMQKSELAKTEVESTPKADPYANLKDIAKSYENHAWGKSLREQVELEKAQPKVSKPNSYKNQKMQKDVMDDGSGEPMEMSTIEKARVDEGKDPKDKAEARSVRNERDIDPHTETGPGGGKLRSFQNRIKRNVDVRNGEPGRPGEKVRGTPERMDESDAGVHLHSNTYGKNRNAPMQGAPVYHDKGAAVYPTGGQAQTRGFDGKPMAHDMVMEGQKKISPKLGKSEDALEKAIPKDWPVKPLKAGQAAKDKVTCGDCGRSWDDSIATSMTPAPSARCPFESFHEDKPKPKLKKSETVVSSARAFLARIRAKKA